MWRRHRLFDLENSVHKPRRSARKDDNAPPKSPRGRHRRSSLRPVNFSETLAAAALKKRKVAPLFLDEDGTKVIRLRALQHMVVCNLRRGLAGEVKTICDNKSAPRSQMERVRKMMKNYGLQATYMLPCPTFVTKSPNACDSLCAARPAVHVRKA